MQEANQVTDVEFTELPKETAPEVFQPAVFLTKALIEAGHPEPTAWMKDIDPLAESHEDEKQRIFFANRALRLYLAEVEGRDNISPRMLLADGIDGTRWSALMTQGIVPWLMGQFDEKTGKRINPKVPVDPNSPGGYPPAGYEMPEDSPEPVSGSAEFVGDPATWGGEPDAVELKEYDDILDLSDDEKAQVRALMNNGEPGPSSLAIGDKTFWRLHRNGAVSGEWSFTAEPGVHYFLKFMDYIVVGMDAAAPGTSDQTVVNGEVIETPVSYTPEHPAHHGHHGHHSHHSES